MHMCLNTWVTKVIIEYIYVFLKSFVRDLIDATITLAGHFKEICLRNLSKCCLSSDVYEYVINLI